jgi:isoleucyl-tRNA synthetase
MDKYDIPDALDGVIPFIDDASNWYVRRSRRRFWKSEDDTDKAQAYQTLHYVLTRLAIILAPFTPFLSEELYHDLAPGESVHLLDWPTENPVDEQVLANMARTRDLINSGLALRMDRGDDYSQIKIRQPLAYASYSGERLDSYYETIMRDELNVKRINWVEQRDDYRAKGVTAGESDSEWVELDKRLTPELRSEGLAREIIRAVQKARKNAGLNVDDRIALSLVSDNAAVQTAAQDYSQLISAETLATTIANEPLADTAYTEEARVNKLSLTIALEKAK